MFPATPAAKLRTKAKYNEVAPNLNTFAVADAGASATPPLALDTAAGRPAGVRENALKRAAEMLAAAKQEKAAAEVSPLVNFVCPFLCVCVPFGSVFYWTVPPDCDLARPT